MVEAGGYMSGGRAKIDGAWDPGRFVVADVVCVAVTQPSIGTTTPAAHISGTEQCAGVGFTGRQLYGASTHIDEACARRCFGVPNAVFIAVAQRAVVAVTPTVQAAVVQKCTGVVSTRYDLNGITAQYDWTCGGWRLVVADAVLIGIAEPAKRSGSPAANEPLDKKGTSVDRARGYLYDVAADIDGSDACWCFVIPNVVGVAVT